MTRILRLGQGLSVFGFLLLTLPVLSWGPHRIALGLAGAALGYILNLPGFLLLYPLGFSFARSLEGRALACVLTLMVLELCGRWLQARMRKASASPEQSQRLSRRLFLAGGGAGAAALMLGGYGNGYELRNLELVSGRLWLPDLPPELEGLRVVLMSDWHCGPFNSQAELLPAIHQTNLLKPDLILIPGDFISRQAVYMANAAELLDRLQPRIPGGILASWGNHDYWHSGIEAGHRDFPRAGARILNNQALLLDRQRNWQDSGHGLWLCGLDDLWAGRPDLAFLDRLPADQPRLVLCHNPDLAEEQFGPRIDLMLSGHTHGGQVRIPVLGPPIVPSRYGSKYAQGLVRAPHYPVYVSRGVGTSGIPIRLGVRPEITCFELHRGQTLEFQPGRLS